MDSRTRRPVRRALAMCCLFLALVALIPVDSTAAARATRLSLQSSSKDADVQRLNELSAAIVRYKSRLANEPDSRQLRSRLSTSISEYEALSRNLGGDQAELLTDNPASGGEPAVVNGNLGTIPPAAAGCVLSTTSFVQSTPVAIVDVGVVTSTVVVSGSGPSLWDLNLQTALTHTFAADLDVTLQSPAGTVVTLSTDNGAGNDNVFNGTVWDDDANPAGQVPYTTNNGMVTDHAYINLTTATPLCPEEGLSAFNGEDPNGTWTITISDDLTGDVGSLDSWTLEVTTLPASPMSALTSATQSTPTAIPTGPAVVTSTLVVAGAATSLCDVNLTTFLTHTFAADLDITLSSPAGTVVTLTTDNGAGNDNVFNGTVWDDDANPAGQVPYVTNNGVVTDHAYVNLTLASPLASEEPMGAFIGEDPNGTWTITISDDLTGDGGSLDSWTLDLTTCTCAPPPMCVLTCPADINATATDLNGAVVTYAPTTSQCINVVCTPPSGSTFPVGTTVVTCTGDDDVPARGVPTPCSEGFDTVTAPALPAGWTSTGSGTEPAWVTSVTTPDSAPNDAFAPDIAGIGDTVLDSNPISVVSAAATVTFRNNFNTEDTFDGMVLEISIGAGPFTDIITAGGSFVTGGYTDTISVNFMSPIAGRQAWSGNSGGYVTTTANLPAAANGQSIVLRWRMATDSSVGATGVRIDTITTTGTDCGGGPGPGGDSTCQFNINVGIPFDGCCVDDASGDIFRQVVASVPNTSPLFGYWEYEVIATGEIFTGTSTRVAYRPGLSIIMDDNDEPTVFLHAEIDFPRNRCRVQVRDLPTSRNFVLRDRNLNNNTCTATPPPQS